MRTSSRAHGGDSELPQCPVCLEPLGAHGGPASLPCGHNGCLDCFTLVQQTGAQCPLCRAVFSDVEPLSINRDLRVLMESSMGSLSEQSQQHHMTENTSGTELYPVLHEEWPSWEVQQGQRQFPPPPASFTENGASASAPAMAPADAHEWLMSSVGPSTWELLQRQPPVWQPDSSAASCQQCSQGFSVFRPRHHCRLCGSLFCDQCSSARVLLPPKFLQDGPQRACQPCSEALQPLQPVLAQQCSPAGRPPLHDVLDWTVPRSWFNAPYTQPLELEVFKCANILKTAMQGGGWAGGLLRPWGLHEAKGLVILTTAKAGMGWSASFGSGLVTRRLEGGTWSPPAGIAALDCGWGLQAGAQVADLVLVIRSDKAIERLCNGGSALGLVGGKAGVALGGHGLQGSADLVTAYSIGRTRGVYAGISIEGTLLFPRPQANHAFYGQKLSTRQLLHAEASTPTAACKPLFDALHHLELLEQWMLDSSSSGGRPHRQTVEHPSSDDGPNATDDTSLPSLSSVF